MHALNLLYLHQNKMGKNLCSKKKLDQEALKLVFYCCFTADCSGDGAVRLLPGARRTSVIITATSLHCIEWDDYNNKAPCRFRVLPALPLGMLILFSKLQSL